MCVLFDCARALFSAREAREDSHCPMKAVKGMGGRVVIGHPRRGLVLVLILYRRGPVTGRCKVPCLTMTAGIMFAKST